MNLRALMMRGLIVTFGILFVYSAWVPGSGRYMLWLGLVVGFGGVIYDLSRRQKTDGTPFAIGGLFILGAYIAEISEVKTSVHVVSVVILAVIALWFLFRIRSRRHRRRTEARQNQRAQELRQRPANWA